MTKHPTPAERRAAERKADMDDAFDKEAGARKPDQAASTEYQDKVKAWNDTADAERAVAADAQRNDLLPGTPVPEIDPNPNVSHAQSHALAATVRHPFEGTPAASAPAPKAEMQPPAPVTSIPPATAPVAVDGVFFLHATAGGRTMLSKAEYDALVTKLAELREAKA